MNGFEKLKTAAGLIEEMTGSRFKHSMGGAFVYPERDEYLAVNMRKETDFEAGVYRIRFDASLQTMGRPMDSEGLLRLHQEVVAACTLLTVLERNDYSLTPEEMRQFNDFICEQDSQREEQEQEQSAGPVMGPQQM
jgi:hypothetical protein